MPLELRPIEGGGLWKITQHETLGSGGRHP